MATPRLLRRIGRALRRPPPVWYDPLYRLPFTAMEARAGLDLRRADHVAWYLLDRGVLGEDDLVRPLPLGFEELSRVHSPALLDRLVTAPELARIFALDPWDVPVDATLASLRLACGGTVAAARHARRTKGPALNLFGGFHHAGPDFAGGHCALNDLALAVVTLRGEGFTGPVVVLDLDAHPPDGTVAALGGDEAVFVGSLSGSDWGPFRGEGRATVDEVVLPEGSGDEAYLRALHTLLHRAERWRHGRGEALALVIAGGDVLAGDKLGRLGLSLAGARERDRVVARHLRGVASVWTPGGGYHPDAWKVLAGTFLAVALDSEEPVSATLDPLRGRFATIGRTLGAGDLTAGDDTEDLEISLGLARPQSGRMLGYYTGQGIELALSRYGVLTQLRRLGYDHFRVEVRATDLGDRFRLFGKVTPSELRPEGRADGRAGEVRAEGRVGEAEPEHVLVEATLERRRHEEQDWLYVHWLSLRHPLALRRAGRPLLPGQDMPGLGMAREAQELLARIALRLGLAGVMLRPAHFHVAWAARYRCRFLDPGVQGRFEALGRDLAPIGLLAATKAVEEGRVLRRDRNREEEDAWGPAVPWRWEAALMVERVELGAHGEPRPVPPDPGWRAEADRARDLVRFEVG